MNIGRTTFFIGMYCLITVPIFGQNTYLELNLSNQAMQNRIRSGANRPPLELFRVIEKAGEDKRINGIIVNASGYSAGQETLWELRNALQNFKSHGKKVCAFISTTDIDLYCLASVADTIVMDELGLLNLTGYAWGRAYVQHTLDKIGAGVRELRYFKYKSASEMFIRDSISEADRVQYGEWLDDIYTATRDTLLTARSWTVEQFDEIINNGFLFSAKDALSKGLVDRVGREDAIKEAVKELEGAGVKTFVCYGNPELSITGARISYSPPRAGGFSRPAVIAVVYASGQTDMEQGMAARSLAGTIRKISENKRVKAIVLRVNSPGGSAEAADYIAEAVKHAQKKMPVVVSMGPVAASGGYWASMYANEILASPYTLTGSIGVIGNWFYDKGLNQKLGFTVDTLQRGNHSDLGTGIILPRRDLNVDEAERYRQLLMDMYEEFVAKVAGGRKMDIEKVEAVAQGRVYSGTGALNAGLIDRIGGLSDAVTVARNLAHIPAGKKIAYQEYPKPKFFERMLGHLPTSSVFAPQSGGLVTDGSALLDLLIPKHMRSDLFYRMANNGRVMPLLPVDCTPATRY